MSIDGKELPSTRRISNRALWNIGIGLLLVALAIFVYLGYGWDWTGFQGNKLFHWLQILVSASIPVAVAIGTYALNRGAKRRDDDAEQARKEREERAQQEQREREQAIETERAEEASLQSYLDYISRLLTDPDRPLRRTHMGDNLSVVARAQTLTVLGRLEDGDRKSSVLQFLHEAGLIDRTYPVVDLRGAILRGANLQGANLQGADLQYANLQYANLQHADLRRAYLLEACLEDANLRQANLLGASLQVANLRGADLQYANLIGARLARAILQGANLQGAQDPMWYMQNQIDRAIGDEHTILPEGIDRPKSWSARTGE
jgi:hypothetical protein